MKLLQLVAVSGLFVLASEVSAMAVDSVVADPLGSSGAHISWSAVQDAVYYDLYRDSVRVESGITSTSVEVSDLESNTHYQFFVTACTVNGMCSAASPQANVITHTAVAPPPGQCEQATDGSAPVVALKPIDGVTAELSWCEVTGVDGYNLFLGNEYQRSYDSSTFSITVAYTGYEQYQVAWFANGRYPTKSTVAKAPHIDPPDRPLTDLDRLIMLDAESSGNDDDVEIYFTRHAEKMTQLAEQEDGSLLTVCGTDKCAEVLNAKGELRAMLLADIFKNAGITSRLTHAFSSHKIRTRQTIEMITADAGLSGDVDKYPDDGIQEYPVMNAESTDFATELDPESTSPSKAPIISALLNLEAGSVALVAGHSGTLYDIIAGLGLTDVCLKTTVDSCNQDRYPVNAKVKVKNFGDLWKITLQGGVAEFVYRVNFQPTVLSLVDITQ